MSDLMSAIAHDERMYIEGCRMFGEKPHEVFHGNTGRYEIDVYGSHASMIREKMRSRHDSGK